MTAVLIIMSIVFALNSEKLEVVKKTTIKNQIELDGEIHKQNLINSVEDFLKEMELDPDTCHIPFRDTNNHVFPIHQVDVENSFPESFHHFQ
jgi:hypothetical protein